jgi:hypothetical protein
MSTLDRIKAVLDKYNNDHHNQVNFASECMRHWIAQDVYDTVMKQDNQSDSATYNDTQTHTQMVFFTNLDNDKTK